MTGAYGSRFAGELSSAVSKKEFVMKCIRESVLAMLMWTAIYGCATRPTKVPHVRTPVRTDPSRPFHLENDYPPESKLLHEEGVCKVKMTVTADGSVRDFSLTQSTGYPRLDQACLIAFVGGGFLPATQDGKPVTTTLEIPITWKLATDRPKQQ